MAAGANLGGAFEDIIHMALFTGNIGMPTKQLEARKIMIKSGSFPTACFMTGAAILSKLTIMLVILLVTTKTGCGRTLEDTILMAVLTLLLDVFSIQFEG